MVIKDVSTYSSHYEKHIKHYKSVNQFLQETGT